MKKNKRIFTTICLLTCMLMTLVLFGCNNTGKGNKKNYDNIVPEIMYVDDVYEVTAEETIKNIISADESIIRIENNKLIACAAGEVTITIEVGTQKLERKIIVNSGLSTNIPNQLVCNTRHRLIVKYQNDIITDYEVSIENNNIITFQKGGLISQKLGKTNITISYKEFVKVYEVEVID